MTTYSLSKGAAEKTKADVVVAGVVRTDKGLEMAAGGEGVASAYGRKLQPMLSTLGFNAKPLDEDTIEELETRLLTADVGVEATSWLIDGMRAANKRSPGTPAVELLRQTALGLLKTVEAPLTIARERKPFVLVESV